MMPQLRTTSFGFEASIQFQIVKKTVVDGDVAERDKVRPVLWFEGSLQPLHSRELLVKPEGERKFKWWTLFTDLELRVDDRIQDQESRTFVVMSSQDWDGSGFFRYELTEGPGVAAKT